MKLQKIRNLMIGLGFFWIFCSTVLGSIVGMKINTMLAHDASNTWVFGLQKTLLVSAHSHMNLMAIITILIGLVLGFVWGQVSNRLIKFAILCNTLAMPLFVCGLLLKSIFINTSASVFLTQLMAFGAILYIISIGIFASIFLYLFIRK